MYQVVVRSYQRFCDWYNITYVSTAAIRATYCSPCCYGVSLVSVSIVVNAYYCHFVDASHVIGNTVAMSSMLIVAMLSIMLSMHIVAMLLSSFLLLFCKCILLNADYCHGFNAYCCSVVRAHYCQCLLTLPIVASF